MSKRLTVENTTFSVMIDNTLTEWDRKVLTHLYQPIIGEKALSIYLTLNTIVDIASKESSVMEHSQFLKLLTTSPTKFVDERVKLEAVGLLSTYLKDTHYIYVLKKVLNPYEFFKNDDLTAILTYCIGSDATTNLAYDMLVRRLDPNRFTNITSSFDDVFQIVDKNDMNYSTVGVDTINYGIKINNEKFDIQYFLVLVETLDVLDKKILYDSKFLDKIYRFAFLYDLSVEDMKTAVVSASNTKKEIDMDVLKQSVKKIYDSKNQSKKLVVRKEVVKSSDKLINFLETASPNELVYAKYGSKLTSTEIEMFDSLLVDTNITLGVLNVMLLYVLIEKQGEIPSYNYFLRIINTWKRMGIKNAEDALKRINEDKIPYTKQNNKKVKIKPEWYDDLSKTNESINSKQSNDSLIDIESFFNPKGKK